MYIFLTALTCSLLVCRRGREGETEEKMTEKVKYAAIKEEYFFSFIEWRGAGGEPDNLLQRCMSIASQSALDKVRENG